MRRICLYSLPLLLLAAACPAATVVVADGYTVTSEPAGIDDLTFVPADLDPGVAYHVRIFNGLCGYVDVTALRSDTMKTALTMLMLCVSAVFAEDAIPPSDLNFGNLVFCITNGVSINAESSPQAESNVSKLSSALAHNGFTLAATNFPWQTSSGSNGLDVVTWRNVGDKRIVYLITCRYHTCHTNDERTVLMRDAEFGNSVATTLNEDFRFGFLHYRHLLTFAQPPKYQRGDHYGVAISSNVFYATGSFTQISHKILRNSNEHATPFGKRMLNR